LHHFRIKKWPLLRIFKRLKQQGDCQQKAKECSSKCYLSLPLELGHHLYNQQMQQRLALCQGQALAKDVNSFCVRQPKKKYNGKSQNLKGQSPKNEEQSPRTQAPATESQRLHATVSCLYGVQIVVQTNKKETEKKTTTLTTAAHTIVKTNPLKTTCARAAGP
jgi:hypothetical protein